MIPLPIWLTNVQFVIGAFSTFAFFAAAWLNLDSWAVRKELKTGMRAFGFLLLALWSALHGIGSEAQTVTILSAAALAVGSLAIAISYVLDKAPRTPQEIDRVHGRKQKDKVAEILRGPTPKAEPAPVSATVPATLPAAPVPAKLSASPPVMKKISGPAPRPAGGPNPPSPGAPLTGLPNKMGFASPSLQAKAGLRPETHVTLPKIAKRRRTRLFVGLIIFAVLLALTADIAYLIITRTNFFKPEPTAQPILIESAAPAATSTPAPSPSPEAKPTVTIGQTETGSLNVRESASTTSAIVTRITPGEEYELLEENEVGEWYKIQVDDDTAGWIAARYATKNEEE